jgi:hypothetical protein
MDYTYLTVTSCPAVFSHYSRNAPGIAYDGTGSAQHQVADEVVEKIKLPGGHAVANYDSVKQGDAIIKAGVGAMGSPHALERVFGYLRSQRFGRKTIATAPGISTASATQSARL